jgi:hypothetical protein
MSTKNYLYLFLIVLVLFGCSKSGIDYNIANSDDKRAEALRYTKRATILNSFETKAIITATFISQLRKKDYYKDRDVFLIGTYISDDFEDKYKYGLNNPLYKLTSNGGKFISKKLIDRDDIVYKSSPFTNNWTHYYLVTYKKSTNSKEIVLTYSHEEFGQSVLKFQKDW